MIVLLVAGDSGTVLHLTIDTTINYYRQYTNMYDKNENINTSTIQIQIVLLRAADSGKHITVAHCI